MYLSHFNLIRISLAAKERECAFNDKSMKFSTNVDLLILNDFRYRGHCWKFLGKE
jgi:hypothetical protein